MTRHKFVEVSLLLLAVAPLILVAGMAIRIWVLGAPVELWTAPAWGLYLLQVCAISAFAFHILDNSRLGQGGFDHWLTQIVLFQQVAMISYWAKHVWGQSPNLRPEQFIQAEPASGRRLSAHLRLYSHPVAALLRVGLIQALGLNPTIMQTLIQKLGKPRSWLVFAVACLVGLVLGGLCVALYFAGLQAAGRVGFWLVVICWVAAAAANLSYFIGQLSGRYRDLKGKSWAELPW